MDGLNGLNGFSMVLKTFFSNSVFSISILLIRNTQQQIDGCLRAEAPGDSKHLPKADFFIDFGHPKF